MRVKALPEDFFVEELAQGLALSKAGPYGIYRVEKRAVSTLELLAELSRIWRLPGRAFAVLGLKDKRSVAVQYLSARGRFLPLTFTGRSYRLRMLGRSERGLGRDQARGNRFRIVLRELTGDGARRVSAAWPGLEARGFPNYFGPQRFGSAGRGGSFAKELLLGRPEAALRVYLAVPARGDRPDDLKAKRRVAAGWGDWKSCLIGFPPSTERSVLTYLKDHPADFMGAVNRIPPRLLEIFLSAWQSLLWNRIASAFLARSAPGRLRSLGPGLDKLHFPGPLESAEIERLRSVVIPLPGRKAAYEGVVAEIASEVFAAEGLTGVTWKPKGLESGHFHAGERALLAFPSQTGPPENAEDDLTPGRRKVRLTFDLPPGSYATTLLAVLDP